jgi:clan AA aspartic protease (TIGR02281 family)
MKKFVARLICLASISAMSASVLSDSMIYKCKNAQGATIYKKAPCDADADTVSTWTPKVEKKPEVASSDEQKKKDENDASAVLTLKQNASGHYMTEGNVDGRPLIFVVDTGASHVSLPEKEAHDAQIYCDKNISITTANGNSSSCTAKAKRLQFGPFAVEQIDVVIAPNLNQPLLGMNVLQLFKISQDKGEMKISLRDKDKKSDGQPKDEKPQP